MKLRRFRHLEGQRPAPEPASPLVVGAPCPDSAVTCARCGDPLPDPDAACARCAAAPSGRHVDRFRLVAGADPLPLGREVAPRPPGSEIASTVPAWRGEALPPDVAAEVQQKLGLPDPAQQQPQREDLLAWAERQLQQERTRSALWWLGAIFFGRRIVANLVGLVAALAVLGFLLLWRACAG